MAISLVNVQTTFKLFNDFLEHQAPNIADRSSSHLGRILSSSADPFSTTYTN